MRIKVLLLGDNPLSVVADAQLLRDRGLLVYTAFNLMNIEELIDEIKPDVIFFDPHKPDAQITDTYNNLVNGIKHTNIPVIFTLSDDDVYLVTRKRTTSKEKRSIIADNMVDAIKMSLRANKSHAKKEKVVKGSTPNEITYNVVNARA